MSLFLVITIKGFVGNSGLFPLALKRARLNNLLVKMVNHCFYKEVCKGVHPMPVHYANTSMQYTAIFHGCKNDNFQMNFFNIFLIFAQNIDCGYTLEPPQ